MADAYGTLTFAQSKDCSYDKKGLLAALNALSWDNEGGCWDACDGQAGLVFCRSRVQYPTVYPWAEDTYIFVSEDDGKPYEKSPGEMNEDDWGCYYDVRTLELSLEELAAIVLPFIEQGWIEIAYSSSEKCRYVEFGLLRLDVSGKSYRRLHRSGPCVETTDVCEQI